MIIQNTRTGKRYEVLKGTIYPKGLYVEVTNEPEKKIEEPVTVADTAVQPEPKKTTKRTYKRKTTKKGTAKKNG